MALSHAVTHHRLALIAVIALVTTACSGAAPTTTPAIGVPGASEGSAGSGGPIGSGGAAGSGGPVGSGSPSGADVTIVGEDYNFTPSDVFAPAGKPFTILFQNKDPDTLHDIDILGPDSPKPIFDGRTVLGPKDETYNVPALPAGTYRFVCSVHPGVMVGTLKAG